MKTMKIRKTLIIFLSFCLMICSMMIIKSNINNDKNNKVYADARTALVEAGIERAEYMYQYRWTPTQTLGGWGTTFYAGNQYTVPYSQPYYYGGYLFYNITLAQFEEYALTGANNFYSYHDNNGGTSACPRYGIDCSAFVSFCIGSVERYTTYTIKNNADSRQKGFYNKSWETATRGDILNCNNSTRQHVLLIKEVVGDNITTYESTPGYRIGYQDIRVRTQTKAQWANDGYNVVGHDYVTNCGGAPKDDVTGRKTGLPVKSNTVLGSCETNNATYSWDTNQAYNTSDANFSNRKVSISSFVGNDAIYFNQSNSTQIKVGATFKATGKTNNELYGKFGIGFFNSAGKGLFTYVDAFGTTGTSVSNITGTNVGVVAKNPSTQDQWDWKTSTNYDIATNAFSSNNPIKIEIERDGVTFDIYVNGNLVKSINGTNYYISSNEKIYPSILTFNTCIEVTDYYSIATHDSLKIDGNLEDWKSLEYWSYINENKKTVKDTKSDRGATFYTRWTDAGLFIYAEAKHYENAALCSDWWQNTNFEIIINTDDATSQYYAIFSKVRGFDSFYFATTGTEGNYTTVLEAFIADCELFENGINIGLAFKVRDYTNAIMDYIMPEGSTSYTDYWWPDNQDPHTLPFTLTKESDVVLPEPPVNSSSSSESSSNTSSIENSQSSSESIQSSSSDNSINIENSQNSTTSIENKPVNNGCGAKLESKYLLLPLIFIAMIIFLKQSKKQ